MVPAVVPGLVMKPKIRSTWLTKKSNSSGTTSAEVTPAPTSDRAMEQLRSGSVDCIVSAVAVGTEDVVSFLSRAREYDDSVPFVLFAADAPTEIVRDLYELDRTDYVMAVPGAERPLLDRIVDLLDGSRMNEEPTQSQELARERKRS